MKRTKIYKKKIKDLKKKRLPKVIIIILLLVILYLIIFNINKNLKINKKIDQSDIELRIENDIVEWKYKDDEWQKLSTVLELTGISEENIESNKKTDNKSNNIILRKTDTYIEWSYIDKDEWTPIIAIKDLYIY